MQVNAVRELKWANAEKISIDMILTIEGIGDIPFHATPNDPEEHGRKLYEAAIAGQFGTILDYSPQ